MSDEEESTKFSTPMFRGRTSTMKDVKLNALPKILEVVSENNTSYSRDVNEGELSSKVVHSSISEGPPKFVNSSAEGSNPALDNSNAYESQ